MEKPLGSNLVQRVDEMGSTERRRKIQCLSASASGHRQVANLITTPVDQSFLEVLHGTPKSARRLLGICVYLFVHVCLRDVIALPQPGQAYFSIPLRLAAEHSLYGIHKSRHGILCAITILNLVKILYFLPLSSAFQDCFSVRSTHLHVLAI